MDSKDMHQVVETTTATKACKEKVSPGLCGGIRGVFLLGGVQHIKNQGYGHQADETWYQTCKTGEHGLYAQHTTFNICPP